MTLFAASVLLAALLIASYGTRRIWLACLSIVLSAALVAGAIFVAATETPAEGRANDNPDGKVDRVALVHEILELLQYLHRDPLGDV